MALGSLLSVALSSMTIVAGRCFILPDRYGGTVELSNGKRGGRFFPCQPAKATDRPKDGDCIATGDALSDHETEKDAISLLAGVADTIKEVMNESGCTGSGFEDFEGKGKAGN